MHSKFVLIALGLACAAAADVSELVKNCNDCHGDKGVSQWSDVPTIAADSRLAVTAAGKPLRVRGTADRGLRRRHPLLGRL